MTPVRTSAAACAGLLAALISVNCAGEDSGASVPDAGRVQPTVPVTTAIVVRKPMPIEIRVIGSAEPYATVAIRSQITGQLIAVNFREGEEVRRGQVLFELDRRPLEAALRSRTGLAQIIAMPPLTCSVWPVT